jgi:BirA family biotin operon repressor/biotin-[acetyl-CoA-carboxylase] ligase
MDLSRRLADEGAPHGTVIPADFQNSGRGRGEGRPWNMDRGKNLPFTLLLRYSDFSAIPLALTLRTGLAVTAAIEEFAPPLQGKIRIKWPNDIMFVDPAGPKGRKIAGILAEGDGKRVLIGIGVNVAQTEFPEDLRDKAGSIALALENPMEGALAASRFTLLEGIISQLYRELEAPTPEDWRTRLDERLFMKDQPVCFIAGGIDSGLKVEGRLRGIGAAGELLIQVEGETSPRPFVTGELQVYR